MLLNKILIGAFLLGALFAWKLNQNPNMEIDKDMLVVTGKSNKNPRPVKKKVKKKTGYKSRFGSSLNVR